jgi:hypothetical protein
LNITRLSDQSNQLIHFDLSIDLSNKQKARKVANCSSEHEEGCSHDKSIPKIEQARDKLLDLQLGKEVEDGIKKHIEGRSSCCQIRPPPPVVVLQKNVGQHKQCSYLAAELEIAHHNCDLSTSEDQNQKHDEQKAKDIIELQRRLDSSSKSAYLLTPNRRQNKEQLDKHGTKRQDTAHQNREDWTHVPHLLRNLSRNLICSNRMICNLGDIISGLSRNRPVFCRQNNSQKTPMEVICRTTVKPTRRECLQDNNDIHKTKDSPNGTAPEDFSPQIKRLSTKKIPKITPGKASAV